MSRLSLSIVEEKVEVIKVLKFPITLVELKYSLGFFSYYKKFILYFIEISWPL
jgi:hypothetical protein